VFATCPAVDTLVTCELGLSALKKGDGGRPLQSDVGVRCGLAAERCSAQDLWRSVIGVNLSGYFSTIAARSVSI